jgi:hypothetical protein
MNQGGWNSEGCSTLPLLRLGKGENKMKHILQMLGVTCVAALAVAAMTAAGASAATFTYSATGTLRGAATTNQVFKTGSGQVTCKKAHTSGMIVATEASSQHVTVEYSECVAFGFLASVSAATYELDAFGVTDIENTITISVPSLGCGLKIEPQKGLGWASYTNKSGKIEQHSAISGMVSTGSGACTGTKWGPFTGSSLIERVGGGTISWDV